MPYETHLRDCPECGVPLGYGQKWCDKHRPTGGAYLDDLIAACDALEQRILDAQQACGRALAALDAARVEMGLPVPTRREVTP